MKHTDCNHLIRLVKATRCSFAGLRDVVRHEAAFRLELVLAALLLPLAFLLQVTPAERGLLIGSVLLVLIVEVLNSAIEAVVDRISEEHHPLSGRAKDYGSAAVFLALANAAAIWGVVLWGS